MKPSFLSRSPFPALALSCLAAIGCSDDGGDDDKLKAQVVADYAALVEASYADSLAEAKALQKAIRDFTDAPSAESLQTARTAWLDSRNPYGQTEAYRFYQGPIDNDIADDDVEDGPEGLINAWPIDERYIDYVHENDTLLSGGIINSVDEFPTIDEELLVELNTKEGEDSISTGYHAIEFLLWGQDLSKDGPGDRSHNDYVTGEEATAENAERRSQYLLVATELLIKNLTSVHTAWQDEPDTYRRKFVSQPVREALTAIMLGMGRLSGAELSGERMSVAWENQSEEDEHSCFSDNTLADLRNNAVSVQNVLLGKYGELDGAGIDDLVEAKNADLAQTLRDQIQDSIDAIDAIPAPFDTAIMSDNPEGRAAVKTAFEALKTFTGTLTEAAGVLGVELTLDE